jgi:nucleoside phosphorylase
MTKRVAVVLTAIQPETEAVLRHLVDRGRERVVDTWFHIGRFGEWTVALSEVGPGNTRAATIAVRALTRFNPEIAAFVGVAGGVKDVVHGDVVVATKVYGYESGSETPDGYRIRPDVQSSDHELEQRARLLRTETGWYRRLNTALWPTQKPKVYVGPIAAGEAVVADNAGRIAAQLREHYGDTLAVEMEGRGFLEAAHIGPGCRAVVVRGIADLLGRKAESDKLGWQQRASDAAAAFFFEMLALDTAPSPGDSPNRSMKDYASIVFSSAQLSKTMSNPRYADDLTRLDRIWDRKAVINRETVIIVVGALVPSELLDRPTAESLRDEIDRRSGKEHPFRRAIVVTDEAWYDKEEAPNISNNAVISVGGPRSNKLSNEFDEWEAPAGSAQGKYPVSGTKECTGFFRLNAKGLPQVGLWGKNAQETRQAVGCYVQNEKGLTAFLRMVWK